MMKITFKDNQEEIKEETLFPLFIKAHNFMVAEFRTKGNIDDS